MKMLDDENLLTEILVRLPPKSRQRFQCVSKQWLSIISSPNFRPRRFSAVSGLFFATLTRIDAENPLPGPHFVALEDEKPQHNILGNRLKELGGVGPIASLSSCNGLLCVGFLDGNGSNSKQQFYVCNPTTNQSRRIPDLPNNKRKRKRRRRWKRRRYDVLAMDIAFDPSKSDHYKVVCAYRYMDCNKIEFSVFSSESRVWMNCDIQFPYGGFDDKSCGAFLNGAIHWFGWWPCDYFDDDENGLPRIQSCLVLCFDVDNARIRATPEIPRRYRSKLSSDDYFGERGSLDHYFGESGGHLHYIEEIFMLQLVDVFEMENDYSRWTLKYRLDLSYVAKLYPILHYRHSDTIFYDNDKDGPVVGFKIHLFEGKEGLVMSFPRKLIFWHLYDMSVTELAAPHIWPEDSNEIMPTDNGYVALKHFETHASV